MTEHFQEECKHGRVYSTCRCISKNKRVILVPCDRRCEGDYQPKHGREPK